MTSSLPFSMLPLLLLCVDYGCPVDCNKWDGKCKAVYGIFVLANCIVPLRGLSKLNSTMREQIVNSFSMLVRVRACVFMCMRALPQQKLLAVMMGNEF